MHTLTMTSEGGLGFVLDLARGAGDSPELEAARRLRERATGELRTFIDARIPG
jgi:hypothetical protein